MATTARTFDLVAFDFGDTIATPAQLADRLRRHARNDAAVLAVKVTTEALPTRDGGSIERTVVRVTCDANLIRNTEAHARGYGAGYVVHTEATPTA